MESDEVSGATLAHLADWPGRFAGDNSIRGRKQPRRKHRDRKRYILLGAICFWTPEDTEKSPAENTGTENELILLLALHVLGRGKTILLLAIYELGRGRAYSISLSAIRSWPRDDNVGPKNITGRLLFWVYYSVVVNILITDLTTVINFEHRNNQCATFSEHSSVRTRFPTRSVSVLKESFSSVSKNRKS